MIKTYISGVSKILVRIFIGIAIIIVLPNIIHGASLGTIVKTALITLAILLLVIYLIYNISYTITPKYLLIKVGFFKYKPISIYTIHKIQKTKSLISGPAAAFDRLEIRYDRYERIVVSPKDMDAFINHLQEVNPKIEVTPQ